MKNKNFCIANWKMNMNIDESLNFLNDFEKFTFSNNSTEIIICPPYTSLFPCIKNNTTSIINWGGQDISSQSSYGAFTGEVSINMIENLGCKYVIVGHSERRNNFNETNDLVSRKFTNIYNSNLTPILCIGESYEDRQNGNFSKTLSLQIDSALDKIETISKDIIIAYEPVWAIGTGVSADINTISTTHALIKNIIKKYTLKNCNIWLLYGGSVNNDNASDIIALNHVDGFLIGGASLLPLNFYNIYRSMGGI